MGKIKILFFNESNFSNLRPEKNAVDCYHISHNFWFVWSKKRQKMRRKFLLQNEYFGTTRSSKVPVLVEGLPLDSEGYNTPSEDSGVCLGDGRTNERWVDSNSTNEIKFCILRFFNVQPSFVLVICIKQCIICLVGDV